MLVAPLTPIKRAMLEALRKGAAETAAKLDQRSDFDGLTLEKLLCDPRMGQFTASPVQRALIRAADGAPVSLPATASLSAVDAMRFHFGCDEVPSGSAPRIIIPRTGVRAGKSLIASGGLLKSVLTCKFRRAPEADEIPGPDGLVGVRPGEFVRAVIVAPKLKLARSPLGHLVGTMRESPVLSKMLVKAIAESCVVRRPDGREVTIELVAADSGGAGLRSTWLAGVLFDEADFHDDEDAAVNLPEQIRAARTRLLPDAQMWIPSSPWTDAGPFHEMFTAAFGHPHKNEAIAFHSDSRSMNPTLSRADEAAERARDPENAAREYDAIPLPGGTARFFPEDAISKSVNKSRPKELPPIPALHYAGADWGFTKNSSALAIARYETGKVRLAYHEELRPTKETSLVPSEVVIAFAKQGMRYGVRRIIGDKYLNFILDPELTKFTASLPEQAARAKVPTREGWDPTRDNQAEVFTEFRRRMQEGLIDLPDDTRLLSQLRGVTSVSLPGGSTKIVLPKQGMAHGDLLMAVVLACANADIPVRNERPAAPRTAVQTFNLDSAGCGF